MTQTKEEIRIDELLGLLESKDSEIRHLQSTINKYAASQPRRKLNK